MEPRDLARICTKQEKRVVVHGHVPIEGGDLGGNVDDLAQEPSSQVDQVYALVDQFAATRYGGVGSPLAFVSQSPPVSVASTYEHQLSQLPRVDQLARPAHR